MKSMKLKKYLLNQIRYRADFVGKHLEYMPPSDSAIQRDLIILETHHEILRELIKCGYINEKN